MLGGFASGAREEVSRATKIHSKSQEPQGATLAAGRTMARGLACICPHKGKRFVSAWNVTTSTESEYKKQQMINIQSCAVVK